LRFFVRISKSEKREIKISERRDENVKTHMRNVVLLQTITLSRTSSIIPNFLAKKCCHFALGDLQNNLNLIDLF